MSKNFTLNDLKTAHEELTYLRSDIYLESKIELLRQKLDRYCQIIIWGDKHGSEFFEYFWEMKGIAIFFDLFVRYMSKELNIVAIDYLSKLLINISDPHCMHLLLSNSMVSNMQTIKFVNMPVELAEYYINFLKSLSLKLNDSSIHLFYNQKYPTFPLAWQAIRFINHPESLVRTTCSNIFPSIMRLKDARLQDYLVRFPFVIYYSHFACYLREYWLSMNRCIDADGQALAQVVEDHYDAYTYFEEIMGMSSERIANAYLSGLIWEALSPLILSLSTPNPVFKPKTTLYLLGFLFKNSENKNLVDLLATLLFGRFAHIQISSLIKESETICSYNKQWSFKTFWDEHDQRIHEICSKLFDGLASNSIQTSTSIQSPNRSTIKHQTTPPSTRTRTPQTEKEMSISVLSLFGTEHSRFESELIKLSKAYGLTYNQTKYISVLEIFEAVSRDLSQNKISDTKQYVDNRIKDLMAMLLASKDDAIVTLVLDMLVSLLKNKHISKHILLFAGLSKADRDTELYNKTFQDKVLRLCLDMFRAEAPIYRIFTLKSSCEVINLLFERQAKGKFTSMSVEGQKALLECYRSSIQRLNKYLYHSGKDWDKTAHMYEKAQNFVKAVPNKSIYTLGLAQSSDLKLFERLPKQQNDMAAYEFAIFFLMRNLRYCLIPSSQTYPTEIKQQDSATYCLGTEIQYGQVPESTECHFKELSEQKYMHGFILVRDQILVILEKLPNQGGARVTEKFRIGSIMHMADKSDPRKLIVSCKTDTSRNNISVMFKDAKNAYNFKNRLEEVKLQALKLQFTEIVKHIERCAEETPILK